MIPPHEQNRSRVMDSNWAKRLMDGGFEGELDLGETLRRLYATDASEYQELPLGVAWPKSPDDVRRLILAATDAGFGLIPRTAGTSLAGQCVGEGVVVDFSRHFGKILAIDPVKKTVLVQPGVIRNLLNDSLREHGLFFGPETSTANRAMIGGMVGNNSCGSNSIVYGSTRDRLVRLRGFLSDGSEVVFENLSAQEFEKKCEGSSLEAKLYRHVRDLLSDPTNRLEIEVSFPAPSIPRRNTGYALDLMMRTSGLDAGESTPFNFCKLIAGSEGTLCMVTEIELQCDPLPPRHQALICGHFPSIEEALQANLVVLKFHPSASELIDRFILESSKSNLAQARNRDFIEGDPAAILVMEFRRDTEDELNKVLAGATSALGSATSGYAFPILRDAACSRVWELRKAGQAVINNLPGLAKPREVVEDTAVDVKDLPAYVRDFQRLMQSHGIECVYYGHAATGELHMRPIFSLHDEDGLRLFRKIGEDVARLVKQYRGSLSGEHGDGRLRGEFVRLMLGEKCYEMAAGVKAAFDPQNIFNPGKITAAPPMDQALRHEPGHEAPAWKTVFDWPEERGILGAAEKCNGAGECLKSHLSGGTMCPSYMATRREEDGTRGRANLLRQLMTEQGGKAMESEALRRVLDLCLGCKGCKSECPSSVDVGKLKAEFMHGFQSRHGVPLRSRLIANFAKVTGLAQWAPGLWNAIFGNRSLRSLANKLVGFHPERSIPLLPQQTLSDWLSRRPSLGAGSKGSVYLFVDEFTNLQDMLVGKCTVELLEALGYEVRILPHGESGRSAISKGLLDHARNCARKNVHAFHGLVSDLTPLVGIEPSALLSFRDEYPDLLRGEDQIHAKELAPHCLLLEEFLVRELDAGRLSPESFYEHRRVVKVHGHCHQKSLVGMTATFRALELVPGHEVQLIPSGCCGMAGSFGYEKEHYDLSMQIGELVLFPAVRAESDETLFCAPGTSCRHQIHDGTGRTALHLAEILLRAVRR